MPATTGVTALARAAAYGHLDVVRYLAANDEVDANMANNWGDTALMEAAANGHVNVVQCLAGECGAAVDVANEWGQQRCWWPLAMDTLTSFGISSESDELMLMLQTRMETRRKRRPHGGDTEASFAIYPANTSAI